ncbi:MAG: hypothetical protein ACKVOP_10820 [Sphingomonadaceae bacterium]
MAAARPPSLAPRAIEKAEAGAPAASSPAPAPVRAIDAALAARIAAAVASLRASDADFETAAKEGAATLASGRGTATGSERWIAAQQVLSALQAARQRSADALAELDSLTVAQIDANAADPTIGGIAELQAAQAEADTIVSRQTQRIDAANP